MSMAPQLTTQTERDAAVAVVRDLYALMYRLNQDNVLALCDSQWDSGGDDHYPARESVYAHLEGALWAALRLLGVQEGDVMSAVDSLWCGTSVDDVLTLYGARF